MFILTKIAEQFEFDREYTGKEVDVILKEIFDDYVSLRRSLIEYGFLTAQRMAASTGNFDDSNFIFRTTEKHDSVL